MTCNRARTSREQDERAADAEEGDADDDKAGVLTEFGGDEPGNTRRDEVEACSSELLLAHADYSNPFNTKSATPSA